MWPPAPEWWAECEFHVRHSPKFLTFSPVELVSGGNLGKAYPVTARHNYRDEMLPVAFWV